MLRRKPEWLKVPLPNSREFAEVRGLLDVLDLHSVCQGARCPNMGECFRSGTATFLILAAEPAGTLLREADAALYRAKRAGRDRVCPHR